MHCFNCGEQLPQGARFCPACGAPASARASGSFSELSAPALDAGVWELCRIEWWRGYVKSDFVARRLGSFGDDEIARSPLFRWRESEFPEPEGKALEAFEELARMLVEEGWSPVGAPHPWYAQTFRRLVTPPAVITPGADEADDAIEPDAVSKSGE